MSYRKLLKRYKQITLDLRRRFWRYLGSYKMHIRMKRIIGFKKAVIYGIHLGSYTKFYHALTKQRRVRNRIVGLHDAAGN